MESSTSLTAKSRFWVHGKFDSSSLLWEMTVGVCGVCSLTSEVLASLNKGVPPPVYLDWRDQTRITTHNSNLGSLFTLFTSLLALSDELTTRRGRGRPAPFIGKRRRCRMLSLGTLMSWLTITSTDDDHPEVQAEYFPNPTSGQWYAMSATALPGNMKVSARSKKARL
ncbi:hypothetical protein J6590_001758 [Homalodisca vitripennis]|nr:hypothetical protein J6590_001758 [Homalodisca vitripennis]